MKKDLIVELRGIFEGSRFMDGDTGLEFWFARDLMIGLGYKSWQSFRKVIEKAEKSCANAGYDTKDHFMQVLKKVQIGSGAVREIEDIALTRYACYLIAQNGDPSKSQIAFAQTYFALQTRKLEILEERLIQIERLRARKKLTASEKVLSGVIYEKIGDKHQSFARIRSKGDKALFGGFSTQEMKSRLGVLQNRALADFLPTITIKAKDFANEITAFKIKQDDLQTETEIASIHVKNNIDVRNVLVDKNIVPENLPADQDIKKIERRIKSESKKLPKKSESFKKLADE